MLYEDEVVKGVCAPLEAEAWVIESRALASQQGDDIVAYQDGPADRGAKGEGSSKQWTNRYGQVFTGHQIRTHVAVAVARHAGLVVRRGGDERSGQWSFHLLLNQLLAGEADGPLPLRDRCVVSRSGNTTADI
jgi:hypothetical protein